MSLYQRYRVDESLEKAGAWVDFGEGIQFRLLGENSPRLRGLRGTLRKKYRQYLVSIDVPQHIEDAMQIEQATAAIVDWRGVTDEAGAGLAYSPEAARKLMTDLRELRKDVLFASGSVDTFRPAEVVEALGKASSPSLSPALSSGPTLPI